MLEDKSTECRAYDYAKFPREFVSYRWFKPVLVALLAAVIYFVLSIALVIIVGIITGNFGFLNNISDGYDGMNAFTGPGAVMELGSIALILPALALAGLIVQDRPFSSYSTSRGGWNWKTFFLCMLVAAAVMGADFIVESLLFPGEYVQGVSQFTTVGLILCIVLVPLQCLAEEYLFRGFLLQTFGAWTRLPILAIVVSAAIFAAGHPYNVVGVITIFFNGIFWGFIAWKSKGLEATSALHIVNNMIAFLASGFGMAPMTSVVPVESLVVSVIIDAVYMVAVLTLGKKFGWFKPKGDGTAMFNTNKLAKKARKYQPPRPASGGAVPYAPSNV